MKKLNTSNDFDQIISLYEIESKRKQSVFSSFIDKIKSLFSKQSIPTRSIPSSTQQPSINFYKEPEIEDLNTFETLESAYEEIEETTTHHEFNLESLNEFFNHNLSKEDEKLFQELLQEETDSIELKHDFNDLPQQPQPEFSSRSYYQRIQKHAELESKNEQLWRRRQAILNGNDAPK